MSEQTKAIFEASSSLEGFDCPFAAHPEQASDAKIDLINKRQILVTFGILNLVDPDGVDGAELSVFQPIGHHMFDSVEDLVP
jgi:hypothetical protein